MAMEATVDIVDKDTDLSLTLWDNVASMIAAKKRSEAKMDIDLDQILGEFQTKFSLLEAEIVKQSKYTPEDGEEVNHRVQGSGQQNGYEGVVDGGEWKLEVERLCTDTDALKRSVLEGHNDGTFFSVARKAIHSQIEAGAIL